MVKIYVLLYFVIGFYSKKLILINLLKNIIVNVSSLKTHFNKLKQLPTFANGFYVRFDHQLLYLIRI